MVALLCAHDFTPESQDSIQRFFYPSVRSALYLADTDTDTAK